MCHRLTGRASRTIEEVEWGLDCGSSAFGSPLILIYILIQRQQKYRESRLCDWACGDSDLEMWGR